MGGSRESRFRRNQKSEEPGVRRVGKAAGGGATVSGSETVIRQGRRRRNYGEITPTTMPTIQMRFLVMEEE